jgi:hypothetical protein
LPVARFNDLRDAGRTLLFATGAAVPVPILMSKLRQPVSLPAFSCTQRLRASPRRRSLPAVTRGDGLLARRLLLQVDAAAR